MLGLSYGFPCAFLLFCHLLLNASPANIIASDDPTVPTPTAISFSRTGALKRRAIMFTHRFYAKLKKEAKQEGEKKILLLGQAKNVCHESKLYLVLGQSRFLLIFDQIAGNTSESIFHSFIQLNKFLAFSPWDPWDLSSSTNPITSKRFYSFIP